MFFRRFLDKFLFEIEGILWIYQFGHKDKDKERPILAICDVQQQMLALQIL